MEINQGKTNQFICLFSRFVRYLPFIFSVQFIDLHFCNQIFRESSRIRSLASGISYTNIHLPISVALLPKTYFCGHFFARIAGSNFAEDTDVRLWCFVYVVQVAASPTSWSLVQRSPTGCVYVCVWSRNLKTRRPGPDFGCCPQTNLARNTVLTYYLIQKWRENWDNFVTRNFKIFISHQMLLGR